MHRPRYRRLVLAQGQARAERGACPRRRCARCWRRPGSRSRLGRPLPSVALHGRRGHPEVACATGRRPARTGSPPSPPRPDEVDETRVGAGARGRADAAPAASDRLQLLAVVEAYEEGSLRDLPGRRCCATATRRPESAWARRRRRAPAGAGRARPGRRGRRHPARPTRRRGSSRARGTRCTQTVEPFLAQHGGFPRRQAPDQEDPQRGRPPPRPRQDRRAGAQADPEGRPVVHLHAPPGPGARCSTPLAGAGRAAGPATCPPRTRSWRRASCSWRTSRTRPAGWSRVERHARPGGLTRFVPSDLSPSLARYRQVAQRVDRTAERAPTVPASFTSGSPGAVPQSSSRPYRRRRQLHRGPSRALCREVPLREALHLDPRGPSRRRRALPGPRRLRRRQRGRRRPHRRRPDAGATVSGSIAGAGASSQQAAMEAWVAGFGDANPDVTVNYDPIGSGGGREQFLAGGVRLRRLRRRPGRGGAGRPPRSGAAARSSSCRCTSRPIAVIYNLEGVDDLQLSAATIAGIFAGTITTWDDPAIAADNPDADLPDHRDRPGAPLRRLGHHRELHRLPVRRRRRRLDLRARRRLAAARAARRATAPPASSRPSPPATATSATPTLSRAGDLGTVASRSARSS